MVTPSPMCKVCAHPHQEHEACGICGHKGKAKIYKVCAHPHQEHEACGICGQKGEAKIYKSMDRKGKAQIYNVCAHPHQEYEASGVCGQQGEPKINKSMDRNGDSDIANSSMIIDELLASMPPDGTCWACEEKTGKLSQCSKCRIAKYCCRKCQVSAPLRHLSDRPSPLTHRLPYTAHMLTYPPHAHTCPHMPPHSPTPLPTPLPPPLIGGGGLEGAQETLPGLWRGVPDKYCRQGFGPARRESPEEEEAQAQGFGNVTRHRWASVM